MIAVFIMLDMVDYMGMPVVPTNCGLFQMLGKYGKRVEKQLHDRKWQRGESLYFMYGAVNPGKGQKGFCEKFWWSILSIAKLSGYKSCYARASNPISRHLLEKMGARIAETVKLEEDNLNEESCYMWLMEVDLTGDMPCYEELKRPRL